MSDLPHTEHLSDEPFTIKPCSIQDLNGSALLSHHLLHKNKTTKSLAGTKVYDRAGIAPPLDLPNFNPVTRLSVVCSTIMIGAYDRQTLHKVVKKR